MIDYLQKGEDFAETEYHVKQTLDQDKFISVTTKLLLDRAKEKLYASLVYIILIISLNMFDMPNALLRTLRWE